MPVTPADLNRMAQWKPVGVQIKFDRTADIVAAVALLTKQQVMVGIPAEAAEREPGDEGETVNNAAIGFLNEFGVPEKNVPARPHLIPGVQDTLPDVVKRFKKAAQEALDGDVKGVRVQMDAVGLKAVSAVRKIIQAHIAPVLAPRTIAGRIAHKVKGDSNRKRARRAGMTAIGQAFPDVFTPLIETGDYIRHLSYVIIGKGTRTVVTPPGGGGK